MNSEYPFDISIPSLEKRSDISLEVLEFDLKVDSNLVVTYGELPEYHGDMVVDPRTVQQILPTKNTSVLDDIVINPIFRQDVTNPSGGLTVTIGLD